MTRIVKDTHTSTVTIKTARFITVTEENAFEFYL